jgi:hypothetical protein
MKTGLDYDGQGLSYSFVHPPVPPLFFDKVYPSRKDPLTLKYILMIMRGYIETGTKWGEKP